MNFEMSLETATTMAIVCSVLLAYLTFMLGTERKKPSPDIILIGLVLVALTIFGAIKINNGLNADHYELWQATVIIVPAGFSIFLFCACIFYYLTGALKKLRKQITNKLRLRVNKALQG